MTNPPAEIERIVGRPGIGSGRRQGRVGEEAPGPWWHCQARAEQRRESVGVAIALGAIESGDDSMKASFDGDEEREIERAEF